MVEILEVSDTDSHNFITKNLDNKESRPNILTEAYEIHVYCKITLKIKWVDKVTNEWYLEILEGEICKRLQPNDKLVGH